MELLLDTHAFLWWNADDAALGEHARTAILDGRTTVYVSAATAWEIELKRAKGKLEVRGDVIDWIEQNGFLPLPIDATHAVAGANLPPHHRDPFDRVLIAQAQLEQLTLVTADARVRTYNVETMDAAA